MSRVHHSRGESSASSRFSTTDVGVELSKSFTVDDASFTADNRTRKDESSPSDNYYKQCLRAGFIDLRTTYQENPSRFSPHHHTTRPSHPHHRDQHHQYHRYQQRAGARKQRELYRSNSSLELESSCGGTGAAGADHLADPPDNRNKYRDYGSANSLDILNDDSFFVSLDQCQDSPFLMAELPIVLPSSTKGSKTTGHRRNNADVSCGADDLPTSHHLDVVDRGGGSGGGGGKKASAAGYKKTKKQEDGASSILKKLIGANDSRNKPISDSMDTGDADVCRQRKAFTHFDCQSIAVHMQNVIDRRTTSDINAPLSMNTGASSARDSDSSDLDDITFTNDLLLRCRHFREETGKEIRRQISSHLRPSNLDSSLETVIPSVCNAVTILDTAKPFNSASSSSQSVIASNVVSALRHGFLLEYVDTGANYYSHYFKHQEHQNYASLDDRLGPVVISLCREPCPGHLHPNQSAPASIEPIKSNGMNNENISYQYRVIVRTAELTTLRGTVIEEAIPSCNQGQRKPRDIIEYIAPEVMISSLKVVNCNQKVYDAITAIDEQSLTKNYKIGVLHCLADQCTEEDMYNNEHMTPALDEFLDVFSDKISLKDFTGYRGGLDCKGDSTGISSRYCKFNDFEIMFHISPMLPFTAMNTQQLLRKRHIGNDIVTIVFQEPGAKAFSPKTIRSQFQHVFIIIRVQHPNTPDVKYSVAVTRSKDVPSFGPLLTHNKLYEKNDEFKYFLLTKIINGENAVYKSDKFQRMAQRTRGEYLKDLIINHSSATTLESNSKFGKFSLGSGRRKDKLKNFKLVADVNSKCAIVWNVQIDDHCEHTKIDGYIAIAPRCLLLVDATSQLTLFAVGCSNIIGWTRTTSGMRIFYNDGECISFTMPAGNNDLVTFEIMEIISRLEVLTNGCESAEMTLKKNETGSLGFQLRPHGLVYDLDTYSTGWENGLRRSSRIVDICGVIVATLTYEQTQEFLSSSSNVVTVSAIAAHDDGTPRCGVDAVWKSSIHPAIVSQSKYKKLGHEAAPSSSSGTNKKKQKINLKKTSEADPLTSAGSRYTVYPAYKQKHNTPTINKSYDTSGCIPVHRRNDSHLTPPLSARTFDDYTKHSNHQVKANKDSPKNRWLSPNAVLHHKKSSDESLSGRDKKTESKFQTNLMKLIDPRSLLNFGDSGGKQGGGTSSDNDSLKRTVSDENLMTRLSLCTPKENLPSSANCSVHSEFNFSAEDNDLYMLSNRLKSQESSPSQSRKCSAQLVKDCQELVGSSLTMESLKSQLLKQTENCDRERVARVSLQRQLLDVREDYEKQQKDMTSLLIRNDRYRNENIALKSQICALEAKVAQLGEWFFDHASDTH